MSQSEHPNTLILDYPKQLTYDSTTMAQPVAVTPLDAARISVPGKRPQLTRNLALKIIEDIARGQSEAAACRLHDIAPQTLTRFKSRHGREEWFVSALTQAYAIRESKLIGGIEDAATIGDEKRGKDWRAGAWLLERTPGSRERWAQQKDGGQVQVNVGIMAQIRLVPGERTPQVVVEEQKQVVDGATTNDKA